MAVIQIRGLSKELMRIVKIQAISEDKHIYQFVEEALKEKLKRSDPSRRDYSEVKLYRSNTCIT